MRYFVATCAVCAGALVSIADFAVVAPTLPRQQPGAVGRHTHEEDRAIFDACVTFYGIAYSTGRLLYRWLGAHDHAGELHRWSRWHVGLLNSMGGVWLLFSGGQAWRQAMVVRPSLVAGSLLLAFAIYDSWHTLRRG
jgi:hypothetical protein